MIDRDGEGASMVTGNRRPGAPRPRLYNGPVETALRTLAILEALRPLSCGREELGFLDHAVVHSADFGGPESLHPPVRGRANEMAVRRDVLDRALDLLLAMGVATRGEGPDGRYLATDEAFSFLELFESPYAAEMAGRARWLADRFGGVSPADLSALARSALARVDGPNGEDDDGPGAQGARFRLLDRCYLSDLARMEALHEAAGNLPAILGLKRGGLPGVPGLAEFAALREAASAERATVRANLEGLREVMAG